MIEIKERVFIDNIECARTLRFETIESFAAYAEVCHEQEERERKAKKKQVGDSKNQMDLLKDSK